MTTQRLMSYAGACSPKIEPMQARVEAKAAAGPTAPESPGALVHRQPTPGSIVAAETRLGKLSPQTVKAVGEAMARARVPPELSLLVALSDGTHTAALTLLGQYSAASFAAASDVYGGTMITEAPPSEQSLLTQPHA